MLTDPITEEIRAVRHELAAQFDDDVSKILMNVRERENSDGRTYIMLPKRSPRTQMAEQTDAGADWKWIDDERVESPPE